MELLPGFGLGTAHPFRPSALNTAALLTRKRLPLALNRELGGLKAEYSALTKPLEKTRPQGCSAGVSGI
jgi:hypothetical protein